MTIKELIEILQKHPNQDAKIQVIANPSINGEDEQVVKGDKYARKCDKCGQGMNEGFCIYEGQEYYCSDECLHSVYSEQEWSEMYNEEDNGGSSSYWTQWEELEEDYQYQIINGELEEIN